LSLGWHSDSDVYLSGQQITFKCDHFDSIPRFGKGDVVGLGVMQSNREQHVFFTLNGQFLAKVLSLDDMIRQEQEFRLIKKQQDQEKTLSDDEKESLKYKERFEYIPEVGIVVWSEAFPDRQLFIVEKPDETLSSSLIEQYCGSDDEHSTTQLKSESSIESLEFYPVVCSDSPCKIRVSYGPRNLLFSAENMSEVQKLLVCQYELIPDKPCCELSESEAHLFDAVKNLQLDSVQTYLKQVDRENIGTLTDGSDKTLMDVAMSTYVRTMNPQYLAASLQIAELLKSRGAVMNIFDAALVGDLNRVKQCIGQEHLYINIQNSAGKGALHRATIANQLEVVRYLLEMGCYVDLMDPTATALTLSVMRQNKELCDLLVAFHANVNAMQGRLNLLQIATKCLLRLKHSDGYDRQTDIIEVLLKNGADAFYFNNSSVDIESMKAERPAIFYAIQSSDPVVFDLFLKNTNDLEQKAVQYSGITGESLLHEIISLFDGQNGSQLITMVEELVRYDLISKMTTITTVYGETVLHFAAMHNFVNIVPILLRYQTLSQLSSQLDIYHLSPLCYAVGTDSKEFTHLLLQSQDSFDCREEHVKQAKLKLKQYLEKDKSGTLSIRAFSLKLFRGDLSDENFGRSSKN